MSTLTTQIVEQKAEVEARIAAAAQRAGRNPTEITLVAVTKTQPFEVIEAAYEAGLRHFGENRVEEGEGKVIQSRETLPDDVTWHMVGHIQSRKTTPVATHFGWVHSVDRYKIARRLNVTAVETGVQLDVLLEVNVSGEESKYGYALQHWPEDKEQYAILSQEVGQILALENVRLRGLMTMAPFSTEPESVRSVFTQLRLLQNTLRDQYPQAAWDQLSMGMSGDYAIAIEEGATMVRIGTALFGSRCAV